VVGFSSFHRQSPRANEGRIQLNRLVHINAYHRAWNDDGAPGACYIDVQYRAENITITVPDVEVSEEDWERLARATDALGYMCEFLCEGKEICSHSCHYPYPEKPPVCTCNIEDNEGRE